MALGDIGGELRSKRLSLPGCRESDEPFGCPVSGSVARSGAFVQQMVERCNRPVDVKLEQEIAFPRSSPPIPMPDYRSQVRKWSTILEAKQTCTGPSLIIGKEVQIRMCSDQLEWYYKGQLAERTEELRVSTRGAVSAPAPALIRARR